MGKSGDRSTVRVKVAIVWVIFLGCWTTVRFFTLSPAWQDALLLVAMVDAISTYFIRCERCHEPVVSLRPDKVPGLWRVMAPEKVCPKCGMERI